MKSIPLAAIAIAAFSLSIGLAADEKKSSIADALKGKLIAAKDGEIADFEIKGDPEYYVLYHSASW